MGLKIKKLRLKPVFTSVNIYEFSEKAEIFTPFEVFSMEANILNKLVSTKMPFGKFKGSLLCDLPEFYLAWFHRKGYPKGTLGSLLATMYEIKMNGLEYLLTPLRKKT